MSKRPPHGHRYTGHEAHLVLVQKCRRCNAYVVLRGLARQTAAYPTVEAAHLAADKLHRSLVASPDPAPLLIFADDADDGSSTPCKLAAAPARSLALSPAKIASARREKPAAPS